MSREGRECVKASKIKWNAAIATDGISRAAGGSKIESPKSPEVASSECRALNQKFDCLQDCKSATLVTLLPMLINAAPVLRRLVWDLMAYGTQSRALREPSRIESILGSWKHGDERWRVAVAQWVTTSDACWSSRLQSPESASAPAGRPRASRSQRQLFCLTCPGSSFGYRLAPASLGT